MLQWGDLWRPKNQVSLAFHMTAVVLSDIMLPGDRQYFGNAKLKKIEVDFTAMWRWNSQIIACLAKILCGGYQLLFNEEYMLDFQKIPLFDLVWPGTKDFSYLIGKQF